MNFIYSTYKVIGLKYTGEADHKAYSDWATDMLIAGYNSPNLGNLAGVEDTLDDYDLEKVVTRVFQELDITVTDDFFSSNCYIRYVLNAVLKQKLELYKGLKKLRDLSLKKGGPYVDSNFYTLYYAFLDLRDFEEKFTFYWDGATKDNINDICYNEFTRWFAENPLIYK